MEYSKRKNLLDNENIQASTFRKKQSGDIINDRHIDFNIALLKSNLCYYSDAYIIVKGTITVIG